MAKIKDLDYYLVQARRIAEHREADAEVKIRKLYKKMLKDLQDYIADAYVKYANGDKLSFADLQKAGYDARFLDEIEKRIMVTSPKAAKELRQLVNDTYKLAYDAVVDGVTKTTNLDDEFADAVAITPQQIKNAVKNPYMDIALQKNHKDIIYDIKQAVFVGLVNGDRYTTVARRIAGLLNDDKGAYKRAVRIARTEAHRVREAGNSDAAVEVDKELQNGTTGMRMCKTWKTMKDERVRPQRRRKGKKGWSTKMGKGANHMILHGQTVLASEEFDLKDGNKAMAPGQSGVAGHDIQCRCYASYEMMTDEEYFAKTGKHFPGGKISAEEQALKKEMELLGEQMKLKADQSAAEKEMQQLDSQQFVNIWKNPVTAKDYETLKDRLPAKRAYFQTNGKQDMLDLCDQFEEAGKKYIIAKDKYTALSKTLDDLADDLKAARREVMKARGIDPAKMQKEIDDLTAKLAGLTKKKKVSMGTKVKNYDQKKLIEAYQTITPDMEAETIEKFVEIYGDLTMKSLMDASVPYYKKQLFKDTLEKLSDTVGDPAEIKRLEKLLLDKTDELAAIRKRYGLEEDKFSKERKDKAYWFTGADAMPRADKVLRPDTGAVWQAAPMVERNAAYKYTGGSGSFNRPLRGYDGGWYSFKGVGKVDLNNEGSGEAIKHLTKLIDKNPSKFDIWLQRGVESDQGAASFLGISQNLLNASEADLKQMLLGKVVKDEAFTSTAAAKGKGFSGRMILNIYAPKGTKMIYAEPFSAYGRGAGKNWDGISTQNAFGSEFEVILQRGTSYKITKVEKVGSRLYVDVDVVGQ